MKSDLSAMILAGQIAELTRLEQRFRQRAANAPTNSAPAEQPHPSAESRQVRRQRERFERKRAK